MSYSMYFMFPQVKDRGGVVSQGAAGAGPRADAGPGHHLPAAPLQDRGDTARRDRLTGDTDSRAHTHRRTRLLLQMLTYFFI